MSERQYEKYINTLLGGRYKLLKIIGAGGMAIVFEGVDMFTQKSVAIKMLKEDFSSNPNDVNVKRFINESKAISTLNHDNIVKIFDFSVEGPQKFIVMEYIAGTPLKEYMNKNGGKVSVDEALSFISQILEALEHAHLNDIVHRDIKPQNIMVLPNGKIKVMDFGIAKIPKTETLTMADKAIGTVYYISPEQAKAKKIDARSDLYSLGVMMYEMITGRLPFTGDDHLSIVMKHIQQAPESICQRYPNIPQGLEQIIFHAMEKDATKRYQNASQMLRHINRLKADKTITFRFNQKNSITGEIQLPEPPPPVVYKKKNEKHAPNTKTDKQLLNVSLILLAVLLVALLVVGFFLWKTVFFETVEFPNGSTDVIATEKTEYIRMPNIVSLSQIQGEAILKNYGICADIVIEENDGIADKTVLKTIPYGGQLVKKGEKVTVFVSFDANESTFLIPDYTGMTLNEIQAQLEENNIKIGNISFAPSTFPMGQIISQSIEAYTPVDAYCGIDLVISGGNYPYAS